MKEIATFASGCFWGVEAAFRALPGVLATRVGYAGGDTENPTYRQVCSGTTGHAEVVEVTFDPNVTDYEQLLVVFWQRQHEVPERVASEAMWQYRSVVYYHSDAQRQMAEQHECRQQHVPILPAPPFWEAETYHQQYLEKRG